MKKFMIAITIIGLIIIVIFLCTNTKPINNEVNNEKTNTLISNVQKNEEVVNTENNTEEIINNEEVNTNTIEDNTNTEQSNTISTETFNEEPKTEQEKAIEIVKKDRAGYKNEKYTYETIDSNGKYVISVRDINTTKALAYYTVDVSNKTFTKREMN